MKKTIVKIIMVGLITNTALFANDLSQNEISQWQQVGIEEKWISNWQLKGVKNADEAGKWLEVGVQHYDVEDWKSLNITPEDAKKWMSVGISTRNMYEMRDWARAGVTSIDEIMKWQKLSIPANRVKDYTSQGITPETIKAWNDVGIGGQAIEGYKANGIDTPQEAKMWKDAGIGHTNDLKYLKKANIKSPNELNSWKSEGISLFEISNWKEIGINEPQKAKEWKEVTNIESIPFWQKLNINNPKDVKHYKDANLNVNDVEKIKKANLDLDIIKVWKEYGINDLDSIIKLKNAGFSTPKKYTPYKGIYIDFAIKLKEWDIKPNNLIVSMSHSNDVFNQDLYFTDKNTFKNAYKIIENECDEIVKDRWFTSIDMSQNKNKCYIFVGKMTQRLDKKSFLGKVTQKGLVSGSGDRYFYAESFQGDWMEGKTKVGVIKGSGSFSYEAQSGTRVVPQGNIVFFK